MMMALSARTKKQRTEMAKRIYMRHRKDIKVRGLRAGYSTSEAIQLDITGRTDVFFVFITGGW
jgi:hypothetical protein